MGSQAISAASQLVKKFSKRRIRKYKDKPYYSVPQAAAEIGVSRMTVLRWLQGKPRRATIPIDSFKDEMSGRFFVSVESVQALRNRERPVAIH
jgi:hypothetical protein